MFTFFDRLVLPCQDLNYIFFFIKVKLAASYVNAADLRRSAIHLLQSMLTLPLHFNNMPIKVWIVPYIVSKLKDLPLRFNNIPIMLLSAPYFVSKFI